MGKKIGEGRYYLRPPLYEMLPCCRCLIHQIDDGLIGDTTVHRKADLAGAAIAVAFGGTLQLGFQVVQAGGIEFRIKEATIACPSATVDTCGRDDFLRTKLSQSDQLLFHAHLGRTASGMYRHRDR